MSIEASTSTNLKLKSSQNMFPFVDIYRFM